MDELLKLHKLSSASARKRKMRERQEKARENKQRTLEKRDTPQFRYGYGYHSDEEELSDNEGSHNTFSPIAEADLDPAAPTPSPSTAGAKTPDDLPSPPYVDTVHAWADLDTQSASVEESAGPRSTNGNPTQPSTKPLLQPTLTSRADFNFEFYTPDFTVDDSFDPDLDLEIHDLEPDTPIEVATPITYSHPRTRPCVISISIKNRAVSTHSRQSSMRPSISSLQAGWSPPKFSNRPSTMSSHHTSSSLTSRKSFAQHPSPSLRSLTLPSGYDRRISGISVASGYPACEATPVDFSAPPVPSIRPDILANASRESLLEGIEDRRSSGHVKKPSLMSNLRKSGLNSIVNYVKDSKTPARESAVSRPTTAVSSRDVDDSNRSAYSALGTCGDDFPPPLRPRTATTASARSWGENGVTALPAPPEAPLPSISRSSTFEMTRKKSLSALRNRSSSIGKALRSASSSVVPTISTIPYPGKPSFGISSESPSRNQSRKASMDLSSFTVAIPSPLSLGRSRNSPRMSPSVEKGGFAWPKIDTRW